MRKTNLIKFLLMIVVMGVVTPVTVNAEEFELIKEEAVKTEEKAFTEERFNLTTVVEDECVNTNTNVETDTMELVDCSNDEATTEEEVFTKERFAVVTVVEQEAEEVVMETTTESVTESTNEMTLVEEPKQDEIVDTTSPERVDLTEEVNNTIKEETEFNIIDIITNFIKGIFFINKT